MEGICPSQGPCEVPGSAFLLLGGLSLSRFVGQDGDEHTTAAPSAESVSVLHLAQELQVLDLSPLIPGVHYRRTMCLVVAGINESNERMSWKALHRLGWTRREEHRRPTA